METNGNRNFHLPIATLRHNSVLNSITVNRLQRKDPNPDLSPQRAEQYSFYCSIFFRDCYSNKWLIQSFQWKNLPK